MCLAFYINTCCMTKDLRRYARQTNLHLLFGFYVILMVVGIGLIYVFYGEQAARIGLLSVLVCSTPLILIALAMALIGWVVKKARD